MGQWIRSLAQHIAQESLTTAVGMSSSPLQSHVERSVINLLKVVGSPGPARFPWGYRYISKIFLR